MKSFTPYFAPKEFSHHILTDKSTESYMSESKPSIITTTTIETRRFSIRQWRAQNKANKALGRPAIKLEEHENEEVGNQQN